MKKICKNYKYYTIEDEELDTGECSCDKFVYGGWNENIHPLNDKFVYIDSEGQSAEFYVGSNFGCVHFKQNTAK